MKCPFLQTKSVKYCGLCRLTMIPLDTTGQAQERCSGPGYQVCSLVRARHEDPLPADGCPYLRSGEVQCCAASAVQKLIPCSATAVSRCSDDGHRHCALYLAMADPRHEATDGDEPVAPGGYAEDLPVPDNLAFAGNHMWLDHQSGRTCHVGVDAFFGRALGRLDRVSYPSRRGDDRPVVRLRAGGVDFDLMFPNALHGAESNAHLTLDPSAVLRDPYGRGWLFEGIVSDTASGGRGLPLRNGLLRGPAARRWMRRENTRLARFVHDRLLDCGDAAAPVMQDGGFPCLPLADVLPGGALVRLHAEFFALPGERTAS